jgi:hypothetical protein
MEAFLREPADHRHVDYFQSLEKFHEQGLPCKLPARREAALRSDPRFVELESEVQVLTQKEGTGSALDKAKSQRNRYHKALHRKALLRHQE